jgi:hypothetical protein
MTKKTFDDSNWREEYKNYTTSKFHLELLENEAKSLAQSWILDALYQKWKRVKNIPPEPEPETPDCQSSFIEWKKRAKQLEQNDE